MMLWYSVLLFCYAIRVFLKVKLVNCTVILVQNRSFDVGRVPNDMTENLKKKFNTKNNSKTTMSGMCMM
jgi:hypothetical protein